MAAMGSQERDAVAMLVEKVNREGGINGRPLKLIYYDDESDESKGVLAIKKLIEQDKVLGIIGTSASGIAMAEAPIVEKAQVPWVTMNSAYAVLLNPPKKWIFKAAPSERFLVGRIYQYMKSKGITKFAWLSQGAGFGRQARKYMQDSAAKEGFTVVVDEEYGPKDTDMKPQLTKVKASDAQALVVYGAEPAGAIAIRQARELGIDIPILGPPSMTMKAIMSVKELAEGMEGAIFAALKPDVWEQLPDSDPQKTVNQEFDKLMRAKYGDKFKRLEWPMGVGYDAFMVMVNAMKRANPDPTKLQEARAKIRDAIEQTKGYIGSASMVTYSPTVHEGFAWESLVIGQIKGGKYVLIK
jgi:branched-chain amino acid transport system substrate-binding protein